MFFSAGDYLSEAKKVQEHNSWFNYALCLHRSREMGYHHRIFIAMTTRQLDKDECREVLVVLFGKEEMLLAPDIHSQWKDFYEFVSVLNKTELKNWIALSGTQESWIDMRKMSKAYSGGPTRRASMFSSWRGGSQKQTIQRYIQTDYHQGTSAFDS